MPNTLGLQEKLLGVLNKADLECLLRDLAISFIVRNLYLTYNAIKKDKFSQTFLNTDSQTICLDAENDLAQPVFSVPTPMEGAPLEVHLKHVIQSLVS